MSYTLVNRIGSALVSLADAKAQSRVTHNNEDTLIQTYLDAAIQFCEGDAQRLMQTSTVKTFFSFENNRAINPVIKLSRPVRAINSINYIDSLGAMQTTTDVDIYIASDNGAFVELTTVPDSKQIWVEYVAGYGSYTITNSELKVINETLVELPTNMKIAALMMCSHFYVNRESTTNFQQYKTPLAVEILLDQVRLYQ